MTAIDCFLMTLSCLSSALTRSSPSLFKSSSSTSIPTGGVEADGAGVSGSPGTRTNRPLTLGAEGTSEGSVAV
jgi:hypothetical protein